jgi:hypothetical protein
MNRKGRGEEGKGGGRSLRWWRPLVFIGMTGKVTALPPLFVKEDGFDLTLGEESSMQAVDG